MDVTDRPTQPIRRRVGRLGAARPDAPRPSRRAAKADQEARGWPAPACWWSSLGARASCCSKGLTNATVFFYNVDQAVAKRHELGDDAVPHPGQRDPRHRSTDQGDAMAFDLKYHGGRGLHVVHTGDVPDLFKPCHPRRARGPLRGQGRTASDQMLLRHRPDYDEKHKSRDRQAEQDAEKTVVNLALGLAGLVLGLVACGRRASCARSSACQGRTPRHARCTARGFAADVLLGCRWSSVFAMQHALLTNDTTVKYVAEQRLVEAHAVPLRRGHDVVGARGLDPAVGADPGRLHAGRRRTSSASA